jgi:tyrosyl-tRNA synthetase
MLKSIGVPIDKLEFVRGSEYQLSREFTLDALRVASVTTLHDAQRAGAEVVRQAANDGSAKLSGLIYPGLQCLDEQYLGVDAQFGGADQRKIFMFAKKLLPALGYAERIHLMNRMVPGLTGDKMSSSEVDSKIDLLDSAKVVRKKLGKAFCQLGNVENNPPLSFLRHVILPLHELRGTPGFHIERDEKWGGPVDYPTYDEVHAAFAAGDLSPEDLKLGLADAINAILEPIRVEFASPERQALVERAYPPEQKKAKGKGKVSWDEEGRIGCVFVLLIVCLVFFFFFGCEGSLWSV